MNIEQIEVSVKMVTTLRDQFAMAALTGLIESTYPFADIHDQAYMHADAMLKAREVVRQ